MEFPTHFFASHNCHFVSLKIKSTFHQMMCAYSVALTFSRCANSLCSTVQRCSLQWFSTLSHCVSSYFRWKIAFVCRENWTWHFFLCCPLILLVQLHLVSYGRLIIALSNERISSYKTICIFVYLVSVRRHLYFSFELCPQFFVVFFPLSLFICVLFICVSCARWNLCVLGSHFFYSSLRSAQYHKYEILFLALEDTRWKNE